MRFSFRQLNDLLDAQANFEQIETRFGFPVFAAAPSNPTVGQVYFDTTLAQFGGWTGSVWHYW